MVRAKVEKQGDGTPKQQAAGDKSDKSQSIVQKNYVVKGLVGKGTYGVVQKVRRIADGLICAMKETNVAHMSQEERDEAVKQIHLLATVRHQNVIKYYDAFVENDKLYTVMEFCERGDLARLIRNRAQHFEEAQIWSYFIQILRGLVALHGFQIIHRDIKSANVMLIDSTTVKLGDLGVPKLLKQTMGTTQIGTPHYMAPEVWKNEPYTFSSDMWALGCVLYELAALSIPFRGQTLFDLRAKLLQGEYPPIPTHYGSGLTTVLRQLLNTDPAWRLSSKEILLHPIVRSHYHLAPPSIRLYVPKKKPSVAVPAPQVQVETRIPKPSNGQPNTAAGLKVRESPVGAGVGAPNGAAVVTTAVTVRRQAGGSSVRISGPKVGKGSGIGGVKPPRAVLSSPGNDKNHPPAADAGAASLEQSSKPARVLTKPLPSLSPMVNNKRLKRVSLVNAKGTSPKEQTAALNRRFKQAFVRPEVVAAPLDAPDGGGEAAAPVPEVQTFSSELNLAAPAAPAPAAPLRVAASDSADSLPIAVSPKAATSAPPRIAEPAGIATILPVVGSSTSSDPPLPPSTKASEAHTAPPVHTTSDPLPAIATKRPAAPRAPLSTPPRAVASPKLAPSHSAPKAPSSATTTAKSPVWAPKGTTTKSPVSTPKSLSVTPRAALSAPKAPVTAAPRAPLTASKIPPPPGLHPIKTRVAAQYVVKAPVVAK